MDKNPLITEISSYFGEYVSFSDAQWGDGINYNISIINNVDYSQQIIGYIFISKDNKLKLSLSALTMINYMCGRTSMIEFDLNDPAFDINKVIHLISMHIMSLTIDKTNCMLNMLKKIQDILKNI